MYRKHWNKAVERLRYGGMTRKNYEYHTYTRNQPKHIVAMRMRVGIRKMLQQWPHRIEWQAILGYTAQELADHIEAQFSPGMGWAALRAGRIHIDHIKPRAAFAFESPHDETFKECWGLGNLRPLWAEENWAAPKLRRAARRMGEKAKVLG